MPTRRHAAGPSAAAARARPAGLPERDVERVAADDRARRRLGLVADEPEDERLARLLAVRAERGLKRDPPLGERAGLVRQEKLDVAEVLDRDEALDEHPLPRQGARSRREADRDDGREELRGDPDGDRQREEQGVDQRPRQQHVDDEDRGGEHAGDAHEQVREAV
jgi:hypothetical protein